MQRRAEKIGCLVILASKGKSYHSSVDDLCAREDKRKSRMKKKVNGDQQALIVLIPLSSGISSPVPCLPALGVFSLSANTWEQIKTGPLG